MEVGAYLCLSIYFIKPLLMTTGVSFLLLIVTGHSLLSHIKLKHDALYMKLLGGNEISWIERGGFFMMPSDMKVVVSLTKFMLSKESLKFCDHIKRKVHNISFYALLVSFLLCLISLFLFYICYFILKNSP